jgi:cell division protein FtsW
MAAGEGTMVGAPRVRSPRSRRRRIATFTRTRSGPWTMDAAILTVLVTVLVLIGLIMTFSASFVDAAQVGDPFGVFRRQLLWAGIGGVAFVLAAGLDHRVWRALGWGLLLISTAGLVLVLVPGVGLTEGGSTRWLAIGSIPVQPSEGAKLALALWLADVNARKREHGVPLEERRAHLLVPAMPVLAVLAVLVMLEPDLGTTLLLGLIVFLVLLIEGVSLRLVGVLGGAGAVLGAIAAIVEPYRFARIAGWLHPTEDPLGSGYQLLQSYYALGTGGWFGVGLGAGRGKWHFVPNPETDFIFAIIGEELGLVGALTVLGLFSGLLVLGLRISRNAPDHFGRVVSFVVVGWIVGQAVVNVGAVTGLLPITGVTLPLVSVGGTSLLVTLIALGIVVSIARGAGGTDESVGSAPAAEQRAPR